MSKWIPNPSPEWGHADTLELEVEDQLPSWVTRTDAILLGDRVLVDLSLKFSWCYRYYLVQGHHVIIRQKMDEVIMKEKAP